MNDKTITTDENKIFEDLYYKENALVALLKTKIEYLEAEIEYLKAKNSYFIKYEVNNDR